MSEIMTGAELREIRKGLGLSQQQMADLVGVIRPTVSDWERGKFDVPLLTSRVMRMLAGEPLLIYKLWPEAKPLIAPPAPKHVPMIERWADDDGAGVTVTTPDGKKFVLGGEGKEPTLIEEPEAAPLAETAPESVEKLDPVAADIARRMEIARKAMAKVTRRKK